MQKLIPAHSIRALLKKKTDEINKQIADLLESASLCKLEYDLNEDTDVVIGKFFASDDTQLGNTFSVYPLYKIECPLEAVNTIKLYNVDIDGIFKTIDMDILTKYFTNLFLSSVIDTFHVFSTIYTNVSRFDERNELKDWRPDKLTQILTWYDTHQTSIIEFCHNFIKEKMVYDRSFAIYVIVNYMSHGNCEIIRDDIQYIYVELVEALTPVIFEEAKKRDEKYEKYDKPTPQED